MDENSSVVHAAMSLQGAHRVIINPHFGNKICEGYYRISVEVLGPNSSAAIPILNATLPHRI